MEASLYIEWAVFTLPFGTRGVKSSTSSTRWCVCPTAIYGVSSPSPPSLRRGCQSQIQTENAL